MLLFFIVLYNFAPVLQGCTRQISGNQYKDEKVVVEAFTKTKSTSIFPTALNS